ncbi:hypothetical protein ACRB8A_14380 [Arthrobacter sp. G.S.26]|uniref:hypothetical protein n=1 Tax=Arthrobacter sp. G.S.26 TaxID=3433706 RepID=UPI003D76E160
MNLWYEALDGLGEIQRGSADSLTVDQKLKIVEIKALMAIGQELNALRLKDDQPFD